jgi:small subunit ribosomal protein S21
VAVGAVSAAVATEAGGDNILDIKVYGNDVEKALKSLKRQLQKDGLLKELKQRSFYEKPSVKDKRKRREALKKRLKAQKFKKTTRI